MCVISVIASPEDTSLDTSCSGWKGTENLAGLGLRDTETWALRQPLGCCTVPQGISGSSIPVGHGQWFLMASFTPLG